MPTGYTAGILDGKIKTFPEFAKTCMRAFGATIHMRDDDSDAEYTPRTPSDYHTKEIEKTDKILKDAESMTDKEILAERKKELEESKKYHVKEIAKTKIDRQNLNSILEKAREYQPPTSEHTGIKDFMIQQITETIKYDGETNYHDEALEKIESELSCMDANRTRKDKIAKAKKDLKYHADELTKDIERCEQSNKWVNEFIKSLNG